MIWNFLLVQNVIDNPAVSKLICFEETKERGPVLTCGRCEREYKKLRKSGKALAFPSVDGLLSVIFLFFIVRAAAFVRTVFFWLLFWTSKKVTIKLINK